MTISYSNGNFLRVYRSELQAFFVISGDFKEQNKEKRIADILTQKLKLASSFLRLLEVAHEENEEVWHEVGDAYFLGYGVEGNLAQAALWYGSAARKGHAKGMVGLARCLEASNDATNLIDAAQWYHKAVALGNTDALKYLALAYNYGRGVPVDTNQANELMQRWFSSTDR